MKQLVKSNSNGFTLIELLLAMALFISVLIVFTFGFIGISRTFSRGVIRKQLSESVQQSTDSLTRAIRTGSVTSLPVKCDGSVATQSLCPGQVSPNGWQALCFGTARFYWNPSDGGLFQDGAECIDNLQSNEAIELTSSRFRVDALEIKTLQASAEVQGTSLFEIRGVFRTKDDEAFLFDTEIPADPFETKCRGTTQSNTVFSCAIENFSFIVNSRGGET